MGCDYWDTNLNLGWECRINIKVYKKIFAFYLSHCLSSCNLSLIFPLFLLFQTWMKYYNLFSFKGTYTTMQKKKNLEKKLVLSDL